MKLEIHRHPGTPFGTNTIEVFPMVAEGCVIEPESASRVVAREVFNGLTAITADGETMSFVMRDSGFEIAYQCGETIVNVDLQRGKVNHSDEAAEPPRNPSANDPAYLEKRIDRQARTLNRLDARLDELERLLQADNDGTPSPGGWPAPPVAGPHSRACGITPHPHGQQCSTNCPTCHGKPIA